MKIAKIKHKQTAQRELQISKLYAKKNKQAAADGINPTGSFTQLNAVLSGAKPS